MSYKVELINLYKKPLDARIIIDKLSQLKPLKVIVDNSKWTVTVEFTQKPNKKLIQEIEKILRLKETVEGETENEYSSG